jgi:GWxTD domain-containing protein
MRALFTATLAALLFLNSFTFSQIDPESTEMFNLDVLNFYSPEGTRSRVDVYIEIPLKNMEFKKSKTEKNNYYSKFDLNIDVFDLDKNLVFNNLSKEVLSTKETGQEYLSRNSQILTRNLFLPPGEYNVIVSIFEQSTKKRSEIKKEITVEDYSTPAMSISNVMIVSKISTSEGKKIITPEVQRNVGTVDTFFLFFYVYKNNDDQNVILNCRVLDPDKKEFFVKKETIDFTAGLIAQNQVFVAIPTADMGFGKFTVELTAASTNYNAAASSTFENVSPDFPAPLKNIGELVEQLQYIAKDDELEYIRDAKTDLEKQKRFLDFWKKKDPSPNTKRNEVMQEYYKRLINANKFFTTTYTPGWKTDMGMVYVIFGEPSNIERHPYDMDAKPYEIWDYYGDNLQFVFVDNTGFGDYRLITPIWDTFRWEKR